MADSNAKRPKTKILVDGGDPEETKRVKQLIGFVDGQTTNPSLIAKNPEVKRLVESGQRLSAEQERAEYRKIVNAISPLVGDAGVSIEVFADLNSTADEMLKQGRDMSTWIPNAYIKYPCTTEGLKAAKQSVAEGIRVNITLCFSQQQAAAVYGATKGTRAPAYVSPFVGRLDDIGQNGVDLVGNIKRMYAPGDGHVHVLAASIRSLQHLMYAFHVGAELATVPTKVLEEWAKQGMPLPDANFSYKPVGKEIPYENIDLNRPWEQYDLQHELTRKGIQKFVADYESTIRKAG
ncbi:MAG TPA: transaldolase family protein [Acidobacteriaceae bacterium]|jgi:transaldolase|nr:transaldolase family protein [Acidobacteriaceae bacterium]